MTDQSRIYYIVDHTVRRLLGWPGCAGSSLKDIGRLIAEYGDDGDHVETGSLFGASAIVAYKTKIEFGKKGDVYCIDPMVFDEHEYDIRVKGSKSQKILLRHQHQIFVDNTNQFSGIKLIRERSHPWPMSKNQRFSTAFIDGWHYGDGPLNDAKTLVELVDRAIMIDDIIPAYPDIYRAFLYLCEHPDWNLVYKWNRVALFEKIVGPVVIFTEEGKKHIHGDTEAKLS